MSTASNNAALDAILHPSVSVIRDTATYNLVETGEAADTVWRLSGCYAIDSDLTANSAAIDFIKTGGVVGTYGVRITCPRDGGTVTAVAATAPNAVANLLFWQSGDSEWQHFVVNVTLEDTAGGSTLPWLLQVDPMLTDGSPLVAIAGSKQPLVLKHLTFTRTS
jgi:hypothetical protein